MLTNGAVGSILDIKLSVQRIGTAGKNLGFLVSGLGFRVLGLEFRVEGLGFLMKSAFWLIRRLLERCSLWRL
jgi:hypothetical protein